MPPGGQGASNRSNCKAIDWMPRLYWTTSPGLRQGLPVPLTCYERLRCAALFARLSALGNFGGREPAYAASTAGT